MEKLNEELIKLFVAWDGGYITSGMFSSYMINLIGKEKYNKISNEVAEE